MLCCMRLGLTNVLLPNDITFRRTNPTLSESTPKWSCINEAALSLQCRHNAQMISTSCQSCVCCTSSALLCLWCLCRCNCRCHNLNKFPFIGNSGKSQRSSNDQLKRLHLQHRLVPSWCGANSIIWHFSWPWGIWSPPRAAGPRLFVEEKRAWK